MSYFQAAFVDHNPTILKRVQDSELPIRANRTSDVIIVNHSGVSFKLATARCAEGIISPNHEPNSILPPHGDGIIFGIESSRYQKGVKCSIKYEGEDGRSWFSLTISNPFNGYATVHILSSADLHIRSFTSQGHNYKVAISVRERPGRQIAGRASQRKFYTPGGDDW